MRPLPAALALLGLLVAPALHAGPVPAVAAPAPPAYAVSAAASPAAASARGKAPGVSGCEAKGDLEVCFSSPPTQGRRDGAVIDRMRELFRAAGEGDALRIAMFRWELAPAADDLLAAQGRGARVELVADRDVLTNKVGKQLLRRLERRDASRRNVVVCRGACLPWRAPGPAPGGQDVNHLKVVLASIDGERSVLSTSSNIVKRQFHQYNSLLRVTDRKLYAFTLDWWKRLRAQSTRGWADADKAHSGSLAALVHPNKRDLVLSTLRRVRCAAGMRQVDVMVAVIQRPEIRRQLGLLHRQGCRVRVVVDRESIENWLQARVRLRDGSVIDLPNGRVRTVSNHDKAIAIHARLGGKERWVVVTGTSNTTCGGLLYNDEIMFRLGGRWVQRQYAAHFRDAYDRAHQSPNPGQVPRLNECRG